MTKEQRSQLKAIADKIAELQAKVYALQAIGDLERAFKAKKGLEFAKRYFAKEQLKKQLKKGSGGEKSARLRRDKDLAIDAY